MKRFCLTGVLGLVACLSYNISMAAAASAPDALVPDGLEPGQQFYVVFVTSNTINGAQTSATYQAFANVAASNDPDTAGLSWTTLFGHDDSTLVTTSAIADPSVPIYNTNGDKVADNRAGFFSMSLLSPILYDESGVNLGAVNVWTGFNYNGHPVGIGDDSLGGNDSLHDGCVAGNAGSTDNHAFASVLSGGAGCAGANNHMYVVSQLLTVVPDLPDDFLNDLDPPQLSQNNLVMHVGETADLDIEGIFPDYLFTVRGSQSVVEVTGQNNRLTISGLAEGSTSIEIYQVIGPSALLAIDVLPALEQESPVLLEQLTEQANVDQGIFMGGVRSTTDEQYYQGGVFHVGEQITIDFAISPVHEHLDRAVRIVIALKEGDQFFLADASATCRISGVGS